MLNKCPDCGSRNQSYREFCARCGGKLSKSHRTLHLMNSGRESRFVLDHRNG